MTFLNISARDFFTSFVEFKPFGNGPWPCLNHAADHYGKNTIHHCHVTDNLTKKKHGTPLGIFFAMSVVLFIKEWDLILLPRIVS